MKAGHEFIISTDDKYAEIGDDKVLYVDYVRYAKFSFIDTRLIQQLGT